MAIDVNTLPLNKQITRRLAKPDTWIIQCYNPNQASPNPHVLVGKKAVLVIDPTWTTFNLRKYIEDYITDKPLWVANSHSHFDHTLANWQFDDCPFYMSAYAWEEIQARKALSDEAGKWGSHKRGTYVPTLLKPGDVLDLGEREIEVLPYDGCHSPGSLVYLDRTYRILFTGDEIEGGQMLVSGRPGSTTSVEKLRDNIARILNGWGDQFDMICPPHNGTPIHGKFMEYLLENCERIMSGKQVGDPDVGSMSYLYNPFEDRAPEQVKAAIENPLTFRSEWMSTSIVYNKERIFRSQVE